MMRRWPLTDSPLRLPMTLISLILLCGITLKSIQLVKLNAVSERPRDYTYVGSDYPREWPVPRKPVLMAAELTVHYNLTSPSGIAEYRSLIPEGDGLLHLGPNKSPFSISMLHELRCLEIIREDMMRDQDELSEGRTAKLVNHCMNYLRQMVLCRADAHLESFQDDSDERALDLFESWVCRDWEAVYHAVEENQEEYRRYLSANSSEE